ncbi:hypothetical protein BDQ17DRAFT_1345613 [Cyathus striatus]|nr:hypothetical protein BDQ17DRAFT_1345613 [Cyathus striatus]
MLLACSSRSSWFAPRIPSSSRPYAISVKSPKSLPGKPTPRVFRDKKAFQYNWYTGILKSNNTSPILILNHEDFTAQRLVRLRGDIQAAALRVKSKPSLSDPAAVPAEPPVPILTVVRTGIFGAALRDLPGIDIATVDKMVSQQPGSYAVLSLPSFDPPLLAAVIRSMDRTVPPRRPKTQEEIAAELVAKTADPAQPGKRMKRQKKEKTPSLKLMGAIIEGRVLLADGVRNASQLPTLDTLRAQLVGLINSPASQLAGVLAQASGGQLARTLEGFKKGLEDAEKGEKAGDAAA